MAKKDSTDEKIKVKFLINPTGHYKLSYNEGEVVELPKALAEVLISDKAAALTEDPITEE